MRELDPRLDDAPCGYVAFGDDGALEAVNATMLAMLGRERGELEGKHVESILGVGSRIFYQTHLFPLVRLHGSAEEIFLLFRAKSGEDVAVLANATRRERGGRWVTECVLMRVRERRKFEDALLLAKQTAEQAREAAEQRGRELHVANEQLEQQALELELGEQQLHEQAAALEMHAAELQSLNDELVERSEELERQREIAEDANRAKSTFLAIMSHELRTPLNAIGGYAELIEMGVRGPVTAEQRSDLERIQRAQRHLLGLINGVLNYAKVDAGAVHYEAVDVALDEVLATCEALVAPQARARGLTLRRADDDRTLVVHADREKVQQVVLNLLSNAVKFTDIGGTVTLSCAASGGGKTVAVRVADTGRGIAPEQLEHVFQPFVQVDAKLTRTQEGTGLGLAISRDLARGMEGDLVVESTFGVGSTFTLTLPRGSAPRQAPVPALVGDR